MLTLFDYLPSQNAWKVRLLLHHLGIEYHTVPISIFEGEGATLRTRGINPTGKVPAIQLEDGAVLAESNAILSYLADGTTYFPGDRFERAKVHQWLSFEQEQVEANLGSLRYWTMTGKLPRRSPELVAAKRAASIRALGILDAELATQPFIANGRYSIADMSLFAYGSGAEDAEISLQPFGHVRAWIARVEAQPGFLATMVPYSVDPHAIAELP
jgi:glutathione S-transferase